MIEVTKEIEDFEFAGIKIKGFKIIIRQQYGIVEEEFITSMTVEYFIYRPNLLPVKCAYKRVL